MTVPVVIQDTTWEIDALRRAADRFDRFLFLKPSVTILDPEWFWEVISAQTGPAWLFAHPSCYLAIYDTAELLANLPGHDQPWDKEKSIAWESRLQTHMPWPIIWPAVTDEAAKRVDIINGRPELIIGNEIIEKAKGTVRCGRDAAETAGVCAHHLSKFGVTP